jgi:hypothetical protein
VLGEQEIEFTMLELVTVPLTVLTLVLPLVKEQ